MAILREAVAAVKGDFFVSTDQIREIAYEFGRAMETGLSGAPSSLKMLQAFLAPPTGLETGTFLALDLGGTNARAALVELKGNGIWEERFTQSVPLLDVDSGIDYRSELSTAGDLFDFLADLVARVIGAEPPSEEPYDLGFTFSFPCRQAGLSRAELIKWTKEFRTRGTVGRDVVKLLSAALQRKGLKVNIKAVINDTVGTFLAAGYRDPDTVIGSILGTGHNSCYVEWDHPLQKDPTVINIEAGNFDRLQFSRYDQLLDSASEDRGRQRLEKMVSGKYIGEITRLIYQDLVLGKVLFKLNGATVSSEPYSLTGEDVSAIVADSGPDFAAIDRMLTAKGIDCSSVAERAALQEIALSVVLRSARLAAGAYLAILRRVNPTLSRSLVIALDGSLYEKMPGYAASLATALEEVLGAKTSQVQVALQKGGSLTGAAIAAAIG